MNAAAGRKTIDRQVRPVRRRAERGAAVLALIAVIGLGVSIFLLNAATKIRPDRQAETAVATALNLAREALIGFAVINRRLPCPAGPESESGGAGAGMEDCSRLFGALPWATLGLSETDSWGRRYSYRVSAGFAAPFDATTLGEISVLNTIGGSTVADQIPAVVISHGKNGFNAWLPSGSRMAASADGDENANNPETAAFVCKPVTESFDDLVVWIDRLKLIDRMEKAGNLE